MGARVSQSPHTLATPFLPLGLTCLGLLAAGCGEGPRNTPGTDARPDVVLPYVAGSIAYGRRKEAWHDPDGRALVRPASPLEEPQLFSLTEDREERVDLAAEEPERVAELGARLERFLERLEVVEGNATASDDELLDSLRALGYVEDAAGDER